MAEYVKTKVHNMICVKSIKNMLELFLLHLISPPVAYSKSRTDTVTSYRMQHIHQVLTVEQLSRDLGLSQSTLKRLLQSHCGMTPIAYFGHLKTEEAKRLLTDTSMNISEIAEQLGFSSVQHFSKTFKRKTGTTPSEFAKLSRSAMG